jgi:uncharacterized protein (DUF3820 family)
MPFGKWKGVRIRLIPDAYLSWLTTFKPMWKPEWRWLCDSLVSELKFRGLRFDLAATEDRPLHQTVYEFTITDDAKER